ncbi:hypothetical protein [Flavisolibacter tropicus]|uniref:Uncharacterized protein n=1 Tax=Flavisolibacter tropicus TaxID=1492898 RepID=A0A172TXH3_9BACT|nr:hypothetical protein [Flavisolibacter tropicus]ANE51789.1 hypothetical protein SY85_16115 [Flavisolibacter tropicus]
MQFNFEKTMKDAADAELIRIVITNRDEYQEAAIAAAEAELSRRNLSEDKLAKLKNRQQWQNDEKAYKAGIPLELHWKIIAFLIPGFFQLIIAGSFKSGGYDRKANEVGKWTIYGISFYLVILIYNLMEE